jgi:hypothetical protein
MLKEFAAFRKGTAQVKVEIERVGSSRDLDLSPLVRGEWWFWAEPGRVLEDALRAGVMDELVASDEAFLHRDLAPGAEAIGKFRQ